MNSWNDNNSGEFIISSGSQCPIEMPESRLLHRVNWGNWVAVAWEPMSDKGNGLGWCEGIEVKKFHQRCHGDSEL